MSRGLYHGDALSEPIVSADDPDEKWQPAIPPRAPAGYELHVYPTRSGGWKARADALTLSGRRLRVYSSEWAEPHDAASHAMTRVLAAAQEETDGREEEG